MEYRYGMRLRGFSPGCQPKGVLRREDDPTGRYYDLLVYDRELTEKEIADYELDVIPEKGDTMKQNNKMSFAEWLETVIGITWEEWDESYSGSQMEQIESEYDEYWDS